jgi:hypothetical protein
MTKIAHAWIRELRMDMSHHRVGCMVAERVSPTKARIAFSLCSPADKMDVKKAKRLAMRRLTEFKSKSIVVDVKQLTDDPGPGIDWASVLKIESTVDKQFAKGVRMYAEERNGNAIRGLLSEVCPVK